MGSESSDDLFFSHEHDVLQKRLEAIYSFRYRQLEHVLRIQELETQLALQERRYIELQQAYQLKSAELDEIQHKTHIYAQKIQQQGELIEHLTQSNRERDNEFNQIIDRIEVLNQEKTLNQKHLVVQLNKTKSYINNFHCLCLSINDAIGAVFGNTFRHCSVSSVDTLYENIIGIFKTYKIEKQIYVEEFYILCDSFVYLLQKFSVLNKHLSTELHSQVQLSVRAQTKILELLEEQQEHGHANVSLVDEVSGLIEDLCLARPEYLRELRLKYSADASLPPLLRVSPLSSVSWTLL